MSSSETDGDDPERRTVVSLSRHEWAAIPERFRERPGTEPPGQVAFHETVEEHVVVEGIPSATGIRERLEGSAEGADDRPGREIPRERRTRDRADRTGLVGRAESDRDGDG